MLGWIYENTAFVSMLTGIATALIWLVYLQLLVTGRRRQRRALMSVNRGAGKGLETHLVLCNLGYETVYVTDIIAETVQDGTTFAVNVTDCGGEAPGQPDRPLSGTLQGPLGTGDCRGLGTAQSLLERIAERTTARDAERSDEVSVVVLAARERFTGIRRRYRVMRQDGRIHLDPDAMRTTSLSRREVRTYRESWGYDVPKDRRGTC